MKYSQLGHEERIKLGLFLQQGNTPTEIAGKLGRHRSTICREIERNGLDGGYFSHSAILIAKSRKQEAASVSRIDGETEKWVTQKLSLQWSPEQISSRMQMELGTSVSHEWIYQFVYRDRKAGGLLHLHLRWGRRKRKKRFGGRDKRGKIPNRVSIEERPQVANDRGRLGDLEGDTIIGANHKGKLLTLVDRKSRLTLIEKLESKSAEVTSNTVINSVNALDCLFMSITFDNGKEFAFHEKMTEETGIPIYFAHPYSSYERGTNENTNGLIRQYFPKQSDLSKVTVSRVKEVENLLNHRPRKVLGYKTPFECHFETSIQYFSSSR